MMMLLFELDGTFAFFLFVSLGDRIFNFAVKRQVTDIFTVEYTVDYCGTSEKSAKFPVVVLETLDLGGVKKLQGEIQNQQKHVTIDTMTDTTAKGFFGEFGGSFVPPRLQDALNKLEEAFDKYKEDESYQQELNYYLKEYVGRPNPLYLAQRLTDKLGGAKIYLKREDLNHTGAHKINNVMGQVLLAKRMGLNRVIAETGGMCRLFNSLEIVVN